MHMKFLRRIIKSLFNIIPEAKSTVGNTNNNYQVMTFENGISTLVRIDNTADTYKNAIWNSCFNEIIWMK